MIGNSIGEDELYAEFFECTICGESNITDRFNFCPDCGKPTTDKSKENAKQLIKKYNKDKLNNYE